jgi:hypothetical protein
MSDVDAMEQRRLLATELEKAANVIAVLMAHINCGFHMQAGERVQRAVDDLTVRGLADHEKTRAELLREVYQ